MEKSGAKNVVLDLDGTLIDAQSAVGANSALILGRGAPAHICGAALGCLRIYKRPGLEAFLDWCFENFDNVGIWTLASKEWLDEVLDKVLEKYPRGKWSFLWTGERATHLQKEVATSGVHVVKDLRKVYRNKTLNQMGYNRWNTVIVEDTPSNCIRNYGNAVYVSPFDILAPQRDDELNHLKTYFQKTLLRCANVRCLDKRLWMREISMEMHAKQVGLPKSEPVAFWMSEKWKPPSLINITARSFRI